MTRPLDSTTEHKWNNERSGEQSEMIAKAYARDADKPELTGFKQSCRESRKYGFPIVAANPAKDESEQLAWAARLLLSVAQSWPATDIPDDFEVISGSQLHNDAQQLVANATGNSRQLGLLEPYGNPI
ncbi:hypothetical protein [Marinobacterium sp. BA1]|uniref:hypothetical protein n=1 Tax=Marinobacterium sp. BA1 TaxID=3138931 RepID=UPI0032E55628